MGHQLDDFFKKKLDEQQFEFNEAHWADALDLIEADEKKDRKPFFYWVFAGVFLLAFASFAFYQYSNLSSSPIIVDNTLINTTKTTIKETPKENNTTTASIAEPITTKENSAISITETDNLTTKTTRNTATTTTVDKDPKPNFETPKIAKKGNALSSESRHEWNEKELAVSSIPTTDYTASSNSTNTVNRTEKNTSKNLKSNTLSSEASHKPNFLNPAAPTKFLNTIGLNLFDIAIGLTDADKEKTMKGELLEPIKSKAFSLGIRGSSILYLSAPDGKLGFTSGITGKYKFNPNWAIGTDLLYHQRRHQFMELDRTFNVEYAFGRIDRSQILRPSTLHSFELPIYVEFGFGERNRNKAFDFTKRERYNKHSIELGVAPIYLYGTKGSLVNFDGEGKEQVFDQGWIETEAYRTLYANALLGYNHNFKDYFSVGIRARYAIGGIVNPSYEFTNGAAFSQPDNFYFDINAKFYLF